MAVSSSRRRVRETPEAFERRTSSRLWLVCATLVTGHVLLLGNLYRIQVLRHNELSKESNKRWQHTKYLVPKRGLIYDRRGALLVQNEPGFAVTVDPIRWFQNNSQAAAAQDTPEDRRNRALAVLHQAFPDADLAPLKAIDLLHPQKSYNAIVVEPWVTKDVVDQVKQLGADMAPPIPEAIRLKKGALAHPNDEIPGVSFPAITRRAALQGHRAAHLLGFTDLRGQQARLGVEEGQDTLLAGKAVTIRYESDPFGPIPGTKRVVPPKGKTLPANTPPHAIHGADLTLTIDAELQHDVEQALGTAVARHQAESGVAIVLDANTGDILAMASAPTFNINEARDPKGPKSYSDKSLDNWCISSPFEPGSTLKTLTIAAALEEKVVTSTSVFSCTGSRRIGKGREVIHCATHGGFPHGHGQPDLTKVLKYSCNLATAECGARLGEENLYHYLTEFGLGAKTDIGLPLRLESRGELKNPLEKKWGDFKLANVSFGQGVSVTPLQLAAAYTTFVDGTYHAPRLIQSYRQSETGAVTTLPLSQSHAVLSEATAHQVRAMLGTVTEEHGTGQLAQIPGYSVGGKTGTAQIAERGGYRGRYSASFIGLVPLNKPQFVILTMIRDPKGADHYGGSVAGPIFKEIAEKALLMHRVPQDNLNKSQPSVTNKKRVKSSAVEA